jgi:hypothetical protein
MCWTVSGGQPLAKPRHDVNPPAGVITSSRMTMRYRLADGE